jgi:adenylate cyclase class IV
VSLGEIRRNVELKASDPDPAGSRAACARIRADPRGVLRQRDTYFAAPHGRLKLRREWAGATERAQLIQYSRSDQPHQRTSAYRIVEIDDVTGLESMLAAALGIEIVVDKRRQLFVWQRVRIHLDEVQGLGAFVELEAVAPRESDLSPEHARIDHLRAELEIVDERVCAAGYAQLLAAAAL